MSFNGTSEVMSARDLLLAAQAVALPYEASADGVWVRFEGAGESAYVIADATAAGYSVLLFDGEYGLRVGQFGGARDAVSAAIRVLGLADQTRAAV